MAKPTQKTTVAIKKAPQDKPRQTTVLKNDTIQPKTTSTHHSAKEKQIIGMSKNGASKEQNEWIAYAFARCGIECVLTFEAESGWVLDKKSHKKNSNGTRDYGICQMNSQYHSKFIFRNGKNEKDGFSEHFKNPYQQLDRCIGIWNDAKKRGKLRTTFYAFNVINVRPGVRDRFTLLY